MRLLSLIVKQSFLNFEEQKMMLRLTAFFLFLSIICVGPVQAQKINDSYRLHMKRASSPILIDGVMDEKAWEEAEVASDFFYDYAHGHELCAGADGRPDDLR